MRLSASNHFLAEALELDQQECVARVCCQSVLPECVARVCCQGVLPECARVCCQSVLPECVARVCFQSVLPECVALMKVILCQKIAPNTSVFRLTS